MKANYESKLNQLIQVNFNSLDQFRNRCGFTELAPSGSCNNLKVKKIKTGLKIQVETRQNHTFTKS